MVRPYKLRIFHGPPQRLVMNRTKSRSLLARSVTVVIGYRGIESLITPLCS